MAVVATSPLWTAIALPSSAVLGAIVTMIFTRVNEATNRRRDRYAEAVQTLVAWTEFPYRVRRRTDDDPATLTTLANHGHDLQERLALHQAWIATEHPDVARTYAEARATLNASVGALINDAWEHSPIRRASDMNLRGWGLGAECAEPITNVQSEIQDRFGVRRVKKWIKRRRTETRSSPLTKAGADSATEHSTAEETCELTD